MRITVTLNEEAYEKMKIVSRRMGLQPATWVSMIATSNVNDIKVVTGNDGGDRV